MFTVFNIKHLFLNKPANIYYPKIVKTQKKNSIITIVSFNIIKEEKITSIIFFRLLIVYQNIKKPLLKQAVAFRFTLVSIFLLSNSVVNSYIEGHSYCSEFF